MLHRASAVTMVEVPRFSIVRGLVVVVRIVVFEFRDERIMNRDEINSDGPNDVPGSGGDEETNVRQQPQDGDEPFEGAQ